ncbi:MAG: hypothetical protein ABL920_02565 [Methylotenera sp.]|nr:hypothetical protein [Methylotenera sp.]
MKKLLIAAAIIACGFTKAAIAADVGVSVSVGQPGFYGRIDIGDYPYPQPRVIYRQPRVVERVYVEREPIYMRVPPGHAKNWRKHCYKYNACGERVYFVQDNWYNNEYVPQYRERHGEYNEHDDRRDEHRDNRKGKRRN